MKNKNDFLRERLGKGTTRSELPPERDNVVNYDSLFEKPGSRAKSTRLSLKILIVVLLLCVAAAMAYYEVPLYLYSLLNKPTSQYISVRPVNYEFSQSISEMFVREQNKDWDKDGILNKDDTYPRDPDRDKNGIPDGSFDSGAFNNLKSLRYRNLVLLSPTAESGVLISDDCIEVMSYTGWILLGDERREPFLIINGSPKKPSCKTDDNGLYVYIDRDCKIVFDEDYNEPSVTNEFEKADFNYQDTTRFKDAGSFCQLENVYASLAAGCSRAISIINGNGEFICYAYGYDDEGLLIADALTGERLGKILIIKRARLFVGGEGMSMYRYYEFEWGGYSSAHGNVIAVFN